jgi:hypothetical protein
MNRREAKPEAWLAAEPMRSSFGVLRLSQRFGDSAVKVFFRSEAGPRFRVAGTIIWTNARGWINREVMV